MTEGTSACTCVLLCQIQAHQEELPHLLIVDWELAEGVKPVGGKG